MLVSWDWLNQYVDLDMTADHLANRLALSGLNHESTTSIGSDTVLDLEVTSNRGDCLGHIGVAREISVLYGKRLKVPEASPETLSESMQASFQLSNEYLEGCPRYTARIIRGVRIGPSPAWLVNRLMACGLKSVNNVVDVTNYVMFECGQPLHAFDLNKLHGQKIVIRRAMENEKFVAIDHRTYTLTPSMIVIADAKNAVAIGGIMGGEHSEVSQSTVDLLIEAADFSPLAIRRTARWLRLHSPASFRFERRVDPQGIDWASRRCCELILETAGGKLLQGVADSGDHSKTQASIVLRNEKITRVLGIQVPWTESQRILHALGCKLDVKANESVEVAVPSWRHDLNREVDLIEEVARVYGYDKIPEDADVPIVPSAKRPKDFMLDRVRSVANAAGLSETLTPSIVSQQVSDAFCGWPTGDAIVTQTPLLEGATCLRRSLIPSLLQVRQHNQSQSQNDVSLFETSTLYLADDNRLGMPSEQFTLGALASIETRDMRGLLEEVLRRVTGKPHQHVTEWEHVGLQAGTGLQYWMGEHVIAWSGQLAKSIRDFWKLDGLLTAAEMNLDLLLQHIQLVPQLTPASPFPAITRDLNLIVDESLRWLRLEETVKQAGGPLVTQVTYQETYRDAQRDGVGKKRILLSLSLQSPHQTLTSQQADDVVANIIRNCSEAVGAKLLV